MAWIAAMEAVHRLLVEASLQKDMWKTPQTNARLWKTGAFHETTGPSKGVEQFAGPVSCNSVDYRIRGEKGVTNTSQFETKKVELIKMPRKEEQSSMLIEHPLSGTDKIAEKANRKPTRTRAVVRGLRKVPKDLGGGKKRVLDSKSGKKTITEAAPIQAKGNIIKLDKD